MALYMTQFSYTTEAWAALAKQPEDRGAVVRTLLESLGGRLIDIYYSTGDYDGLIIFEVPDGKTAATAILTAIVPGHVKVTKTIELFTMEETMEMIGKAGSIAYSAPKG